MVLMVIFRSQTTKGIWLANCAGIEPCTLVMDLEGTDGRERGEVPLELSILKDTLCALHFYLCVMLSVHCFANMTPLTPSHISLAVYSHEWLKNSL